MSKSHCRTHRPLRLESAGSDFLKATARILSAYRIVIEPRSARYGRGIDSRIYCLGPNAATGQQRRKTTAIGARCVDLGALEWRGRYVSKWVSVLTRTAECPSSERDFYPPDEGGMPRLAGGRRLVRAPAGFARRLPSILRAYRSDRERRHRLRIPVEGPHFPDLAGLHRP